MQFIKTSVLLVLLQLLTAATLHAQMERKRANIQTEVKNAFWTPNLTTLTTTEHIAARNMNVTIMHSFGIATNNVVRNFFGLDNVQNVRLGLDFGLTDRWSAGIGRSSQLNVVDLRTKYALLQQDDSSPRPVSISVKGDLGIITQENRRPFEDDISTLASVIISRKFSKTFSMQIAPIYAHFNRLNTTGSKNLFSVGIGSAIHLSDRYGVTAEYYPVLGDRIEGTKNAFSLGLSIETGGHVFQLFLASTEWHLEQYVLANNDNQFWAGDFRFGFNVNRIFGF